MKKINHSNTLGRILKTLNAETLALTAREGSILEFKETFNWGSKDKYAKTMAAFANNRGGYLLFGITNFPRRLVGLSSQNFENLDEATIAAYLNGTFSPEIHFEKFSFGVGDKQIGVIYTYLCEKRPIIPIKNDGDIKEAEIYHRYNARNDKIKYPELVRLFDLAQERERTNWMDLFERVSKIGPGNAGVMDLVRGTIEGAKGSLLIDAALIPKLRFIKEGTLTDAGKPALKLVGEVQPVVLAGTGASLDGATGIRLTNDPTAPSVREENILDQYPLTYLRLVRALRKRYNDFKQSPQFHKLKGELQKDPAFCKTRLLDPRRPNGSSKDFYSENILTEFDKHYTRRPPKLKP